MGYLPLRNEFPEFWEFLGIITINIGKSDTPGLNNNNYLLAMTG